MPLERGDPSQIGRYHLAARLGAGGMGVVYLGEADDGQQVAVKVLRPGYADDPEFQTRFQREVAALARVRNRYTVQVIDADTDAATPFLVTEFAEGPSLSEHVNADGPLDSEAVCRLASALAEALDAVHAAGVTHRDLKPSNVLLTDAGPKVIDFGIARLGDEATITRTGSAIGSPGYMAPEQVTGHAGQEADIFAWALIVAFAAGGQPPFGGGETIGVLYRIVSESPDISAVPPQLMSLVQGALAKDPARRPTAADLVRELSSGGIVPRTAADPETAQRRRGAAAAAAIVVLAGTGGALLYHGGPESGNGSSAGPRPMPSVTSSAASGKGQVPDMWAPGSRPGSVQGTPPGLAAKHKLDKGAADHGSNQYGGSRGKGGGAATSRPSATVAASPSGGASVSPSPSPSASASVSPSTSASPSTGATGSPSGG